MRNLSLEIKLIWTLMDAEVEIYKDGLFLFSFKSNAYDFMGERERYIYEEWKREVVQSDEVRSQLMIHNIKESELIELLNNDKNMKIKEVKLELDIE